MMARLKLDENLGRRGAELLASRGHGVATVREQGMCAAPDRLLVAHCASEGRCLVTLDLDFANPLVFPPHDHAGLAVLRLPHDAAYDDLFDAVRTLADGLDRDEIRGHLWVVQPGRIRVFTDEG
jgi:hypothetical protein